MRPFILVGDKTTHGGTVISGAPVSTIDGKQMARMGDKVACPIKGHGICTIISGDLTFLIEGAPAARAGDMTSCGAVLIPSQVTAGEEVFTENIAPLRYNDHKAVFDKGFILQTGDSREPMADFPVWLKRADGSIHFERTNKKGETSLIETEEPEEIELLSDQFEIYIG